MDTFGFIQDVSALVGPSGYEMESAAWFRDQFSKLCDEVYVDNLYNVIAIKRATRTMPDQKTAPRVMLAAHQDEIALIVNKILDDGSLRIGNVGGVDPRILPAVQVKVHAHPNGEYKPLDGVICCKHPKLLNGEERERNYTREELYVDIGYSAEEVRKLVHIGDRVTLIAPAVKLLNGRAASKTMDDRACVGCLLQAAERLQHMDHLCDVYFVATTQEEVGSYGAKVSGYAIDPDMAIALDVCHATIPDSRSDTTVPLDAPAVTCGPFIHHKLFKHLRDTAEEYGITINTELAEDYTWTDADDIQIVRNGVPSLLIDLPLKYMHTSVELLDMKAMKECGRLLSHFLSDMNEGWLDELWI